MDKYEPDQIETKWQRVWADARAFNVPNPEPGAVDEEKWYQLEMLPYPSGNGMHMGHVFNYTMGDVLTHYHRRNGRRVLRPMGWDAFGLPAEQYALKTGTHPKVTTERNVRRFREQLQKLGLTAGACKEIGRATCAHGRQTGERNAGPPRLPAGTPDGRAADPREQLALF